MNKFDRYFKSKTLRMNEKLVNTYVKYDDFWLISNGYGVVYTKTMTTKFKENTAYAYSIKRYFENFNDESNEIMMTLDIEEIKTGLDDDKRYRFSRDYGLDYIQLKKVIDIIGCNKIEVLSEDNFDTCFIKITGKNNQIGYLLPYKIY